jgi:DNA-binding CsgD family transcriptional regulator
LRELLLGNVHRLTADARAIVRIAAVIGLRAPRALLAAVSGLDDARAQAAARAAVDGGVLLADDDGRGYDFRHALLRQAVLDDLVPDERVALHRAIAQALDASPDTAIGIDRIAELARHWDAAEDAPEALRCSVAAGEQAVLRYAFEAAFAAYERALAWWDVVAHATTSAGRDRVELLFAAANAAGLAGHIGRAADLARAALDTAAATAPDRCVDAVGRAYPLLWSADRAGELSPFTAAALPVLERADALAQARFLESLVDERLREFRPAEALEYAPRMVEAAAASHDTELEIRARWLEAHCHELLGEFDRAIAGFEEACSLGRRTKSYSALALACYNKAAAYLSLPDFAACERGIDEVDALVEQYGIRRYAMPARCLRAANRCIHGDLATAGALITELDEDEGIAGWFVEMTRALVAQQRGEPDTVLRVLDPRHNGLQPLHDVERLTEVAMLRAEALAWKGDLAAARTEADHGFAAVTSRCETYWHCWLAMVSLRVEADAAVAATKQRAVADIELAQQRAETITATWAASTQRLRCEYPWTQAFSLGSAAELARLSGTDPGAAAAAATAFDSIGFPYYAAYFRWREAEVALAAGDQWRATQLLSGVRQVAQAHGFHALEEAADALARLYQVRLGPRRTTVDGDEALSDREQEVLRLLVDGKSNPEIAEALFIGTRTARSHVSNILRKLGVASRIEAVADAHRRGLV